jgi:UDPglucose 6-dehydrogenase
VQLPATTNITERQSFRTPDFDLLNQQLRQPLIFDGHNRFDS